jgi:hypothetical protein
MDTRLWLIPTALFAVWLLGLVWRLYVHEKVRAAAIALLVMIFLVPPLFWLLPHH